MKAIFQERFGSPDVLQLREVEKPAPEEGRVLVKVCAASVNALDWHVMRGWPYVARLATGLRRPHPPIRGVDVAGIIEAIGPNVSRLKAGDEVFGEGRGTFAEYTTSAEADLVPKPGSLTFEQAAALPVAGLTALQGLRDRAELKPGQRVLINGAGGGVGTFAVQIAKGFGAHVAAVTRTENLDRVRSLGVDEVVDYTMEDFVARGRRYDLLLDVGGNRSLAECRRVLNPKGTYVMIGGPKGRWFAPMGRFLRIGVVSRFTGQRMMGFVARSSQKDLLALAALVEARKLSPVIDRRYPLSETPAAMRYVEEGHARGKVIITVS